MQVETASGWNLWAQTEREIIPLFELVQEILNSFEAWKPEKSEAAA
jgi:hypothetical protein